MHFLLSKLHWMQDIINTAALLAATSLTASTCIYTAASLHGTTLPGRLGFASGYGMCLGCTYTLMHLFRCVRIYPRHHFLFVGLLRLPPYSIVHVQASITFHLPQMPQLAYFPANPPSQSLHSQAALASM